MASSYYSTNNLYELCGILQTRYPDFYFRITGEEHLRANLKLWTIVVKKRDVIGTKGREIFFEVMAERINGAFVECENFAKFSFDEIGIAKIENLIALCVAEYIDKIKTKKEMHSPPKIYASLILASIANETDKVVMADGVMSGEEEKVVA